MMRQHVQDGFREALAGRRRIVAVMALVWVLNSAAICFAATRAEAAMACCPPSDCVSVSAASQSCCTVQSNPARAVVSPVVLTDHVADDAVGVVTVASAAFHHHVAAVTPYVVPHAPPGCNSILRI